MLDKICDRIHDLGEPAFIKNSELVFVAVNDAFAQLFNLQVHDLVGTSGDSAELEALLDIEDKERACLVFGEDQVASFADPFGKGRFRLEMERFTLADGQTFLYCVFCRQLGGTASGGDQSEKPEAPRPVTVEEAEKSTGAGPMTSELAALVVESLVGGICIYSENDELIYFNEKLQELYSPLIGDLRVGITLREVLTKIADDFIRSNPNDPVLNRRTRDGWIAERIDFQRLPYSVDMMPLSNGKWLQCINRRLPSGIFIGLRVDVTEMKEQEALLEKHIAEADLYRELLNRLPVATFARGPDQTLAFVNQAYAELLGRKVEDLIGTSEAELFGESAEAIAQANHDTLVNGTEYEQEQELPASGGRTASTIVKTGRLITENGTPHVIGTIVDISSIRQRELQLKSANDQLEAIRQDFENIVASIDVGLIVLDKDLTIQLVNDAYRKQIWGKGAERWKGELVGSSFRDLLRNNYESGRRPEMFDDFEEYYLDRVAELRSGSLRTREVVFKDGTVTLYSGIKLSGGKFLLCYVDLTELRRRDRDIELAHREAEHAYQLVRSATDTMPEGLMVIEDGKIALTNRSLAKLLNVPEDLLESQRTWEDAFLATCWQNPGADDGMAEDNLARFRQAIETRKDVSYNFPLDGERWVHVEMRHKTGDQTVIVCSDLTEVLRREVELKRLIAKAEAADRAKSEFLANMSLEIRTPMNGILGMAELLSKSALDTRQKAFIEIIMKSGNALMTIINDILDFSKLDAGHMQLKYAPFDPAEALEDVASLFAAKAAEKNVELIVKRAGSIPGLIMGDAGRFRQIINNLISNAVKFTERGHVSASIGAVSDGHGQTILNVMIEDTGTGIPADKLNSIFEKFSQVEITSNRREGTGLGLAIAQRLASVQGGAISVHSSEGKGSTFTLGLPVQVAAETSRQKPLPANVEGARILIVDDHDIARDHLLEHAQEWGFESVGAADGATGLSILAAASENHVEVDAVLIDSEMPDMDGPEMARRIRSNPALDRVAIILLSPQDVATYEIMVGGTRVEAHLTKPIRIPLLRETLIDVVRAGRARIAAGPREDESQTRQGAQREAPEAPVRNAASGLFPDIGAEVVMSQPGKPYVLVAEDNEVNRIFFSQVMQSAGLNHLIVDNGEAAVRAWQEATPSIIIMDSAMPLLDGLAATRRIRAFEAANGGHTPIVGVVSHSHDSEDCIAAGMDDHISKPVSPERLQEKIRHWTGREYRDLVLGLRSV